MSSVFVNKSERVEVKVYYRVGENGVFIAGVNKEPEDGKPADIISATFRRPDFVSIQAIMQSSTVFDSGTAVLDIHRAGKAILYHLVESWDVKDDKGQPVPCDAVHINSLHPAIGNALSVGIQSKLGNIAQMFVL